MGELAALGATGGSGCVDDRGQAFDVQGCATLIQHLAWHFIAARGEGV